MPPQAQANLTPLPVGTSIPPGSLRAEMESRRAAGHRFDVREAIGLIVPLCTQLHELHDRGTTLLVHPSSLGFSDHGMQLVQELAHALPTLPRDRACLAPEERKGAEGDARASVFTIGAILYEMLTNSSVGPGMRRPSELVPDLPPSLEIVLGKALVADPKHRPADLAALAQALHQIAPNASTKPPPADASRLDSAGDFDVDVQLSMMPPAGGSEAASEIPAAPSVPKFQAVASDGPFAVAIPTAQPAQLRSNDPTRKLADLKAALEADPRPRYVVVKDGMDHGPFSAVELLQQIASGSFTGDHVLRDSFSSEERAIQDWEEFAPFAEQAKLNRDIVQEKRALEAVVTAEKQGTQYKALVGLALMGVIAAAAAGWWYRERSHRERELAVQGATERVAIEVDAGLGKGKSSQGGGARASGGGNYPTLAGGLSCEAAQARYVEEYKLNNNAPPDLTAGSYGAVLNRGSYLNACSVPSNMEVSICAAVQNGRAVGVTVTTNPPNGGIASCVAGQVRALPFPSHPRLDVARTTFAAN